MGLNTSPSFARNFRISDTIRCKKKHDQIYGAWSSTKEIEFDAIYWL